MEITTNSNSTLKKIFTGIILVLPILNVYASFIPKLPLGDLFLIISVIYIIINNINITLFPTSIFMLYIMYIFIQFMTYSVFFGGEYFNNGFFDTFHYLFYLFILVFFTKENFIYNYGLKLLKYISIIATIYIIFQEISLILFNFYIPGQIPGLPLLNDEITLFNNTASTIMGFSIRSRSFFAEPAHYAQFIMIYLSINLFKEKNKFADYIPLIFVSIGILISKSSTGILGGIGLWLLYFMYIMKKHYNSIKVQSIIAMIFSVPLIIYGLIHTNSFNVFLDRAFSNDGLGKSSLDRISSYSLIFLNKESSFSEIFFGRGMASTIGAEGYMPGFVNLFYYFGILGSLIFFSVLLYHYQYLDKEERPLFYLMLLLNIGGDSIFGFNLLLFIPFMRTFYNVNKGDYYG